VILSEKFPPDLPELRNLRIYATYVYYRRESTIYRIAGIRAASVLLMSDPEAGDVIEGTGGLRKLRFADARWGKGKRGGLRVIYYRDAGLQFWLFTVYDKHAADAFRHNNARCSRH